jgi:hypothetical protein
MFSCDIGLQSPGSLHAYGVHRGHRAAGARARRERFRRDGWLLLLVPSGHVDLTPAFAAQTVVSRRPTRQRAEVSAIAANGSSKTLTTVALANQPTTGSGSSPATSPGVGRYRPE